MRVIAGKYRGRKIISPVGNDVRPTTDKIKETLFNILQYDIADAVVVDLFGGTGGLGVEALSRGAKKVYFCDIDNRSLNLIKQNVSFCDRSEYEIIKGDYADCIRRLALRGVKADIIICDPPYRFKKGERILAKIKEYDFLNDGGVITIERAADDGALPDREYFLESTRVYGNVSLDIFRNASKVAVTGSFDPFTTGHKFLVEKGLESFGAVYVVMLVNENKTPFLSVENRLKIIENSLREYKRRVKIEFFSGLTIDYCREKGIPYIIRGVRSPEDFAYERAMADYNLRNGGVETLFIEAEDKKLSSTLVKDKFLKGESLSEYVCEDAVKYVKP